MSTFRRENGVTRCVACHAIVGDDWRAKARHQNEHLRGRILEWDETFGSTR